MSRVRVHCFSISIDGYGTGAPQTLENPFGHAGEQLHQWMVRTAHAARMFGAPEGSYGAVNDMVERSFVGIGATIMGRNMFGPQRGPWEDDSWQGWWGENPPYHHPTFVMTHHHRPSIEMEGGTTFHFVDGSASEVLAMAKRAAGDEDVCIRGGVNTLRAFFREQLIDEAHLVMVPVVLGDGENLWDGLADLFDHYEMTESLGIDGVIHLRLVKKFA